MVTVRLLAATLALVLLCVLLGCTTTVDGEGAEGERGAADERAPVAGPEGGAPEGRWRPATSDSLPFAGKLSEEQLAEVERLRSIGYMAGSRPAGYEKGVVAHDRSRACPGLNLYTSGHFPGAVLMDMDGSVLHLWERSFRDVWPDDAKGAGSEGAGYWRHVHLFPNGDVLAIFEGLGLVKLDRDSRVLWSHAGGEHHDLKVYETGHIFVLTREIVLDPRVSSEHPILEDSVTVLDSDGREVTSVSVLSAMGNSEYLHLLAGMKAGGDVFHTNAIEILDGSLADVAPGLAEGNVLLSLRKLSLLIAVNLRTGLAEWALEGSWRKQHDPSVLANGNVLLFDNNGGENGASRVIEINPASGDVEWSYDGEPSNILYSQMCGAATRLANGNTLATESDAGRAVEVTPDGEIVWDYRNPERAGEDGEFVATLFEVTRLPGDFPLGWLTR